jgi:epoxyqueuosine reductase
MDIAAAAALTLSLRTAAAAVGFDACGVAPAARLSDEAGRLRRWLERGEHAGMGYMERNVDLRTDPARLLDGLRSVVVLLMNYKPPRTQPPDAPQIARYAYGVDYHRYIHSRLRLLAAALRDLCPGARLRGCVDTAPVMEKAWAVRAGLGWVGKNTLLISPAFGSFTFVAVLLTDVVLEYSTVPERNRCGACRRCLDACPTKALEPYRLDANRCLSYHNKRRGVNGVPTGNRCFGCDVCQLACPWNDATPTHRQRDWTIPEIVDYTADDWRCLDEPTFLRTFARSVLKETGFAKLKSNIDSCSGKPS